MADRNMNGPSNEPRTHQLPDDFIKNVTGYCDPLSALPGEIISFRLGAWSESPVAATLELVELISGDDRPHGTGLIERSVVTDLPTVEVIHQPLNPGSYAEVEGLPSLDMAEVSLWVYPTLTSSGTQTLIASSGCHLVMDAHGFSLRGLDGEVRVAVPVVERRWHHVTATFGGGQMVLSVQRRGGGVAETDEQWRGAAEGTAKCGGTVRFAAAGPNDTVFNGRLEAPAILSDGQSVAEWDFSLEIASQRIVDVSGNAHHGRLHQTPVRGVRGVHWDGSVQSFHDDPAQYGAIHFHEDDLTDAGWSSTFEWPVPEDMTSGQYALKVQLQDGSEDYIPFFVRAPAGRRGTVAYLVPTASYLAYANQRLAFSGGIFGSARLRYANEAFLYAHEDLGYSMYEHHRDHSGVHFSSRLRPVLNMKPKTGTWAFNADTHITAWLHATSQAFDVVTDEDLHREGASALAGYRVVVTGTHPEYYSTAMRGGLSEWLSGGGRLMYMGGNGFYWRVAFSEEQPGVMEVRRAEDGTRAWLAEPGEYYQQFNGEYGGLWRRLGAPPNELVGIGFAAQGFDGGTYYRVQPGALDPRVAFIVDGIDAGDTWGAFGNQGGGAAGEEIDRWDPLLGSPAHAVVLASSENHRPGMLRVKEEFHMMEQPRADDPDVRADMVFYEVPGGGAVFSTGSISYAGSLAHNGYDNEIAHITGNVLRRFNDATPFEMPDAQD